MKREDILSWDEYYMGIAILSQGRSKDDSTQVGACIVKDKRILSIGYNGSPNSLPDEDMKWGREGNKLDTKYPYMVHAEANAILNYRGNFADLKGAKMYTTLAPCNECAKLIIQTGIIEVVYLSDKHCKLDDFIAGKWLLNNCNVKCTEYKSKREKGYKYEINL